MHRGLVLKRRDDSRAPYVLRIAWVAEMCHHMQYAHSLSLALPRSLAIFSEQTHTRLAAAYIISEVCAAQIKAI